MVTPGLVFMCFSPEEEVKFRQSFGLHASVRQGLPTLRSRVLGGHPTPGSPSAQGQSQLPSRPASWSLLSLFPGSEGVQRVDSQVPGEEHVEPAEPQELAAVAGHGPLQESEHTSANKGTGALPVRFRFIFLPTTHRCYSLSRLLPAASDPRTGCHAPPPSPMATHSL